MAFTTGRAQKASRFSLLLLEDGEVLLSDLAVQYRFTEETPIGSTLHPMSSYPERLVVRSTHAAMRGRVKIGTRNIFFDSDDWRDPVIRIPLVSISSARSIRDNSRSRRSEDNVMKALAEQAPDDENSVQVLANNAVLQREQGSDHPYVEVQLKGKHTFTPLYSSALQLLDEINVLLQITASSSRRVRDERLRNLVGEREARVPFDITLLEHGVQENAMMDSAASAVYAVSRAPGRFRITAQNVYFMPIHGESSQAVERIPTRLVKSVRRLRHGCRNAALEIGYFISEESSAPVEHTSLMVSFQSFQVREKAIGILLKVTNSDVELFDRRELDTALNKWRRGQMSNFQYLMYLNMAAGRSFNDLSQYPVFPWVLKDYDSDSLDLSSTDTFRDLTKPIGALEPKRLATLQERYNDMQPPRFFYGTHYSTPAYTINYLVRAAPAAMLRLQNGKFDTPDRLFHSMSATWEGVMKNQGDVKELIPEFYSLDFSKGDSSGVVSNRSCPGEFLDNVLGLDFGTRQDGKRVDDVELPPWAHGSSELFVRKHREALECDYVSSMLHTWIDLIFGIKSRNAEACNIFYTDAALPRSIESEEASRLSADEKDQVETVYLEFGRTPETLFAYPHPPRFGDVQFADFCEEDLDGALGDRIDSGASATATAIARGLSPKIVAMKGEYRRNTSSPSSPARAASGSSGVPPLSLNAWGAQSRRRDSVLLGASDHILMPYEPAATGGGTRKTMAVPSPLMSRIVDHSEGTGKPCQILDICIIETQEDEGFEISYLTKEYSATPVICTLWSDGYLKVHSESGTLRSKHIGDACCIVQLDPGMIAYGNPAGSIGLYNIETGKAEIIEPAAHDAEVFALECVKECHVVISGSKDASIKVWRMPRSGHRVNTLRLIQELDAESSIDDLSGYLEVLRSSDGEIMRRQQLLVAAATCDGQLLAWEVDLSGHEDGFPEPVWRAEKNAGGIVQEMEDQWRRKRTVTWLYQGPARRPALASIHREENCIRMWDLNQRKMALAEVFVTEGGAKCISQCGAARTVVVGGKDGEISEYDSTGLCLGRVTTGKSEVRDVLLPDGFGCIYVFAGVDEVWRVNR
eukprot:GFKZ01008421.1.p1 GENE.GFKZ01008421.1~~GFKZ01008421.1.p1  ORF type:complete len:1093 (-),score=161.81 GFKZ01008421.1:1678-4956(-)